MDAVTVLVAVLGFSMVAFSLWCRAGRSETAKWWAPREIMRSAVLIVWPALGVAFAMATFLPFVNDQTSWTVPYGLVMFFFLGVAVYGIFFPVPRWVMPKWLIPTIEAEEEAKRRYTQRKKEARAERKRARQSR